MLIPCFYMANPDQNKQKYLCAFNEPYQGFLTFMSVRPDLVKVKGDYLRAYLVFDKKLNLPLGKLSLLQMA